MEPPDIQQEEAREERVARYRYRDGRVERRVPLWGLTAGSWAQLFLGVGFSVGFYLLARPFVVGKGALDLFALLGAFVLGFVVAAVFWRLIGARNRDRARTFVRFSPLLLLAGVALLSLPGVFSRRFEGEGWKIPSARLKEAAVVRYRELDEACARLGAGWRPADDMELRRIAPELKGHKERIWIGGSESGGLASTWDPASKGTGLGTTPADGQTRAAALCVRGP